MKMLDIRRYEMLVRVKEFGAAHAELFPATTLGGRMFGAVGAAVDDLKSVGAAQASRRSAAREGTSTKAVAREKLRGALSTLSRTARAMAIETPGLDDKFRMPRSNSDQRLIAAARAFVQDAAPLGDQFIAHDLPATLLADLSAGIEAFERAIREHAAAKESHAAARAGIERALEAGLDAVDRLDAIVPNRLEADPEMLAAWTSARRVSQVGVTSPRHPQPAPEPSAKAAA